MCKKCIHVYPKDFITTSWSGGATTQIAIYPRDSQYADRDFLWRISSATVELEESDFTPLPDYNRYLSVLSGEMQLIHNEIESFNLSKGQIYAFDGAVPTKSKGICTDFNLMVRKNQSIGSLSSVSLAKGGTHHLLLHPNDTYLIYCQNGRAVFTMTNQKEVFGTNEALLIESFDELATLQGLEITTLMVAKLNLL